MPCAASSLSQIKENTGAAISQRRRDT